MNHSVLDAKGLFSYNNPLGAQSIPGSMSKANNVNCDQVGITTTRRGVEFYSANKFTVTGGRVTKLFVYRDTLYASFNAGQFAQDDGTGTWTTYGSGFTMLPPSGGFLHQMLAGGNSYFTTSNGIYKLSGVNASAPIPAGAPSGLDGVATPTAIVAGGFLNAKSSCAYSIVWGYTDEENLQIVGTPSNAFYAVNTSALGAGNTENVNLVITMPPFVVSHSTLPWFYQVYRTPNTGDGATDALAPINIPPGNNYKLVEQKDVVAGDYTNRDVSYSDVTLDDMRGATLYTADGQPGVGNPYGQPPLAKDVAYFSNMAFYANYSTLQNVFLTLVSAGAPNGIQVGDTIAIKDSTSGTSYTYTGGAANNPTTRTFFVDLTGTPSVNIQNTAKNLCLVINRDPNNTHYIAEYISSFSALPGQIKLTAQNLSQAFFSIISSRTTCWTPTIPSSGITYASANASVQNGLFISEIAMPESVPPSFLLPVGSPNFPITRLQSVRTALVVIKQEEGVFLVTGTSPQSLTVTQLDSTAFIKASETVSALNNSAYFFTTQGVMLVNESGCEIMSRNIQGDLLALASYSYPNFPTLAFSIGYQSDNAYIIFLQAQPTDEYSTLQYRYNWITQAWTTWDIPCTAAVVNTANDRLYLATPDGYILQERKTFTNSDYAGQTTAITINSIVGSTFVLASSATVGVGDLISQVVGPATYTCFVTANDTVTNTVTVDNVVGFTAAAASLTSAIHSTVGFMPTSANYPAFIKKFTTWNFEFAAITFDSCTVSFTTDFFPQAESVTLVPQLANGWGTFAWGTVPWGVTSPALRPIPTYSTKNTSIAHWVNVTLDLQQAYSGFALCGYTAFFSFLGERSR